MISHIVGGSLVGVAERHAAGAGALLFFSIPSLLLGLFFGLDFKNMGKKWPAATDAPEWFARLVGGSFGVCGVILIVMGLARV